MKKRLGFVSNSSSSSFICQISGEEYSGMDASLEDAEMYQCEAGHTFSQEYLIGDLEEFTRNFKMNSIIENISWELASKEDANYYSLSDEDKKEYNEKAKEKIDGLSEGELWERIDDIYDGEVFYSIPKEQCPICTLKYVMDDTINEYLFKVCGRSKEEVVKEIQEFKNLEILHTELEKE